MTPTEAERTDAVAFASRVRQAMADFVGVPCTNHSYDDVFLAHASGKVGVIPEFEMAEIKKVSAARS